MRGVGCASEVIVHKENFVLGDLLFLCIVRGGRCLQRGVYQKSTDETACDECKDDRGKNCEKDDYGYPDSCDPCYPYSIHNNHHQPANILVSVEYQWVS
jgi:hypothetical protein